VRWSRRQRVWISEGLFRDGVGRQQAVAIQERRERQEAKSSAGAAQEVTPRDRTHATENRA